MDKRKEFDSMRNKGILARECGTECVCCGVVEGITYHHIMPLVLGGDNRFSNIVPVCRECHGKIHGQDMTCLTTYSPNSGRPRKQPPEGYKRFLPLYFEGRMSWKRVQVELGISTGTHARDVWWVKEYAEELGIEKYEKYKVPKHAHRPSRVSKIWYKDGRITETYRRIFEGELEFETIEVAS